MNNHCMVDLETLALTPDAAILSLGAVAFDPEEMQHPRDLHKFYLEITVGSNNLLELRQDEKAIEWHKKQNPDFDIFVSLENDIRKTDLWDALAGFYVWFQAKNLKYIWSHGVNFDIPILENATRVCDAVPTPLEKVRHTLTIPWKYSDTRDTRTVFWLAGVDTKKELFVGKPHHALDDALHQVRCVQKAMAILNNENRTFTND